MVHSRDRSLSRDRHRHRTRSGSRERHRSPRGHRSPDTRHERSGQRDHRRRSPADDRHRRGSHRERHRSRSRDNTYRDERRPNGHEDWNGRHRDDRGYGGAFHRDGGPGRPAEVGIPDVGSVHRATVASVRPFGVFVRSRTLPRDGLVHATQIDDQIELSKDDPDAAKIQALTWAAQPGSEVWVMVVDVQQDGGGMPKLACSMRAVDQESGQPLMSLEEAVQRRRGPGGGGGANISGEFAGGSADPPEVGAIVEAVVEKVAHFGVFVKMRGFMKSGLVYSSQVSDYLEFGKEDSPEEKAAALASVVSVGEHIWVKVVEVSFDERGPRTGCSMKVVDQKSGSDLDPQGLKYRPRGEGGFGAQRAKETVGVVTNDLNIEWGHLAADVVQYGNSKDYAIVGDEVEAEVVASRLQQSSGAAPSGALHDSNGGIHPRMPGGEAPMAPRGRGRDAVQPAWMTQGVGQTAAAPGSGDAPSAQVSSVAEALAIIEKLGGGKHKKGKRKKEGKKKDKKAKEKKKNKAKERSTQKREKESSSSESE